MRPRAIAAAVLITITAAACGTQLTPDTGGPPYGQIPFPSGADQVILRISTEGGFISPLVIAERVPQFSLFGDGTVITVGAQPEIYPGAALPPVLSQKLTADGIQTVLKVAFQSGLGRKSGEISLGHVGVSDAATTVFTFNANGTTETIKAYALGAGGGPDVGGTDGALSASDALRKELEGLAGKLSILEQWLPKGSISASKPYLSDGARVFVSDYRPDPQLTEPEVAWPLSTPLARFGAASGGMGPICGTATGSDWTGKLRPLVNKANQLTPWTSGGARYALGFRPLLPDENGC